MKKKAKEHEEVLFVKVNDPINMRRGILGCLKDIMSVLERFEKFKTSRERRFKDVAKLKQTLSDINKLISRLKSDLPKTSLKVEPIKSKKPEFTLPKKPKHVIHKREKSEFERLEAELADIEKKIRHIG